MSSLSELPLHQVKIVPPRADVRLVGAIAGRYNLPSRRDAETGKIMAYACRLSSISPHAVVVMAPVIGELGEAVSAHFDDFGILRGTIATAQRAGFSMALELSEDDRLKLASKIAWKKKTLNTRVIDKRDHKRLPPRDPRAIMTLADGTRIACFIIDISASGVAVSAEKSLEIGTQCMVGKIPGRVVRHLLVGFAVEFDAVQDIGKLEALTALHNR